MIRVLVADDHPVVRIGLREILARQRDIAVLGEAGTGAEVCKLVEQKAWDVIVLDVTLPDRSGLDVLKEIKRERPKLPILILSAYPEEDYAVRALRAGAAGYVTKSASPEELVRAVRRLAQGLRYMSPAAAEELIGELGNGLDQAPHERLSDREYQVLCLLGSGKSVGRIAQELERSVKTISTYRARILEKMDMQSNASSSTTSCSGDWPSRCEGRDHGRRDRTLSLVEQIGSRTKFRTWKSPVGGRPIVPQAGFLHHHRAVTDCPHSLKPENAPPREGSFHDALDRRVEPAVSISGSRHCRGDDGLRDHPTASDASGRLPGVRAADGGDPDRGVGTLHRRGREPGHVEHGGV